MEANATTEVMLKWNLSSNRSHAKMGAMLK